MATTQQVVAVLTKAGKQSLKLERGAGVVRNGYQVAKWNHGLVGVLCGTSDLTEIDEFKKILADSGFAISKPENVLAIDGFFVR